MQQGMLGRTSSEFQFESWLAVTNCAEDMPDIIESYLAFVRELFGEPVA